MEAGEGPLAPYPARLLAIACLRCKPHPASLRMAQGPAPRSETCARRRGQRPGPRARSMTASRSRARTRAARCAWTTAARSRPPSCPARSGSSSAGGLPRALPAPAPRARPRGSQPARLEVPRVCSTSAAPVCGSCGGRCPGAGRERPAGRGQGARVLLSCAAHKRLGWLHGGRGKAAPAVWDKWGRGLLPCFRATCRQLHAGMAGSL